MRRHLRLNPVFMCQPVELEAAYTVSFISELLTWFKNIRNRYMGQWSEAVSLCYTCK